ncbi:hypothetical protein RYX36_012610 [Vicia faba]
MAEEGYRVALNVYDLSQGLARQLSMSFLGKAIEGIWHKGIVVYGNEYYYGSGIQHCPAESIPYGTPLKVVDLDYILQLPNEVMSSPMGALMLPMIQNLETTLKAGGVPQMPQFKPSTVTSASNFASVNTKKKVQLDLTHPQRIRLGNHIDALREVAKLPFSPLDPREPDTFVEVFENLSPHVQACIPDLLKVALTCLDNVADSDRSLRALRAKTSSFIANNVKRNWPRDLYERVA